jgi:hypothetical protein
VPTTPDTFPLNVAILALTLPVIVTPPLNVALAADMSPVKVAEFAVNPPTIVNPEAARVNLKTPRIAMLNWPAAAL